MNELSGIEKFLQSKREVGQVEFDAEFTIDSLRALRKLAASQLPVAGLWLVKLVQAAVVMEAHQISINFGKRLVEFQAEGLVWNCCHRRLLSTLLSGELSNEPFLFHLLAGLRGSILEDTVEAHWIMADEATEFHIRFHREGTEISEQAREYPGEGWFRLRTTRPPRWPGLKRATTMPLRHLIRRTADEFMAVCSHCWSCPVPLKVDGRVLERRYLSSPKLDESDAIKLSEQYAVSSPIQAKPSVLLRRCLPVPEGRPPLQIAWPEGSGEVQLFQRGDLWIQQKKKVFLEDTWLDITQPTEANGGYLLLLFAHQMDSQVEFYCDGARVDVYPLPWRSEKTKLFGQEIQQNAFKVGVRVLLPVTTDQLDLSHFKVREAQALVDSYSATLQKLIQESAELCLERGEDFLFHFAPRPDSGAGKILSGLTAAAMSVHLPLKLFAKRSFRFQLESLLKSLQEEAE